MCKIETLCSALILAFLVLTTVIADERPSSPHVPAAHGDLGEAPPIVHPPHVTHENKTLIYGSSMMFELPDNEQFCFYQHFPRARRFTLEYHVVSGGNNDVDVTITSPNGKLLYRKQRATNDEHVFETSLGDYRFCFSNEFSSFTHKRIYFDLQPTDVDDLAEQVGMSVPTVHTQMEEALDKIHQSTASIENHQEDQRIQELTGFYVAEELHERVQWWSMAEMFLVVMAGMGQVAILRRFFSDKKDRVGPSGMPLNGQLL